MSHLLHPQKLRHIGLPLKVLLGGTGMVRQRPKSIFDGITSHLVVAMAVLAVVLALGGCVALRITMPWHILMSFVISALTVAAAGAVAVGALIFVDGGPVERAVNGLARRLSARKLRSSCSEDLVDGLATVIESFAPTEGILRGRVRVGAETWNAKLDVNANSVPGLGDRVEVVRRYGLVLVVRPFASNTGNAGAA